MEEEGLAATRGVAGREARLAGTVRLTAPETFGGHFLASWLGDFHRRYPEIALELVADNRTLSLNRREADVALRLVRSVQPLLVTRKLAEVATTLYASEGYSARTAFAAR
ncbi:LysR substrate-binding domain-containing protein [Stigmatella erecta]|uniref:LysR substrate binding domain-containing protein n=1 Tax=Stigmatella erecta TaxID=83460 RepID=A0A1I0LEF4_9BACT|nr:LysR substrate-binding domain-containing protein [Stigmatella erecta]SEU38201.1 LysR substrate binding domain-containing protein [Stigmatella erecta]